jgi:putative tryptophan/tyrosine transport system substrate-binding protein
MSIRRREFITLLGGTAAWPLAARAQQAGKVPRIGFLSTGAADSHSNAFKEALRELRYVEGETIAIEWRFSGDRVERLPELAAGLVRLGVDLMVVTSTAPANAARAATSTTPIVFVAVSDPVEFGFIKSLAQPGGNMTGLANTNVELSAKRLEILREVLPRVTRIAVLWNPTNPSSRAGLLELEDPARALGVELYPFEAQGAIELGGALVALMERRPEALVLPNPLFSQFAQELADFTTRHRLPTMYGVRENAEAGGLMSYGPNLTDMNRRAATFVDKILKGAKPADLPVERPTKFELVINLKTAKAIGLEVPPIMLTRADEVIE